MDSEVIKKALAVVFFLGIGCWFIFGDSLERKAENAIESALDDDIDEVMDNVPGIGLWGMATLYLEGDSSSVLKGMGIFAYSEKYNSDKASNIMWLAREAKGHGGPSDVEALGSVTQETTSISGDIVLAIIGDGETTIDEQGEVLLKVVYNDNSVGYYSASAIRVDESDYLSEGWGVVAAKRIKLFDPDELDETEEFEEKALKALEKLQNKLD